MAVAQPGDCIIAPPPSIGGHVTHHRDGAAGRYGLKVHLAAVDPQTYSVDLNSLRADARRLNPKLITIGGSLNLFPHPIREIREIADEVGAWVLFDAAHLSGMIAGHAWQQPLTDGAHIMTMSTYKSLGGPPSGLIVSNEPELAKRIDAIAYPGLTANFDVAKSVSLAISFLDWKQCGRAYAAMMHSTAHSLAMSLAQFGVPIFAYEQGITASHQFALNAVGYGGGQAAARILRRANILSSGIGLPVEEIPGDVNGLRLGTPEIVRRGMTTTHMPELAAMLAAALNSKRNPGELSAEVTLFRRRFEGLHFVR
jgi:glycine hydroxymethyltransferase